MRRPSGMGHTTKDGFVWGPVEVERTSIFRGTHVVTVNGLDIYVSPTGKSVRVFRPGAGELKPAKSQVKAQTPKARRNVSAGQTAGPKRGAS